MHETDECSLRGADPCRRKHSAPAVRADSVETRVAAASALRSRLLARQSDLHSLFNTRRLLLQRGHLAHASLQQARARTAACAPAVLPPPLSFGAAIIPAEHEEASPREQQSLFSPSKGPPAPGLARFKAHCGINTDTLARMQGAAGGPLDLSRQDLRVLMDEYRSRIAGLAELREEQICWYLVSTWEVAPGAPLSFGLGLTTAACAASFSVLYVLCQLECGLLLDEGALRPLCCALQCRPLESMVQLPVCIVRHQPMFCCAPVAARCCSGTAEQIQLSFTLLYQRSPCCACR